MPKDLTPEEFARELIKAVRKVPGQTVKVVRTSSVNVKRGARRNVRKSAPVHNAHAFRDINFDLAAVGTSVVGEIGYDTGPGKAGNLGNLLEFGGGKDHSPPHRDLGRALDAEAEDFADNLLAMGARLFADAAEDALARRSNMTSTGLEMQ